MVHCRLLVLKKIFNQIVESTDCDLPRSGQWSGDIYNPLQTCMSASVVRPTRLRFWFSVVQCYLYQDPVVGDLKCVFRTIPLGRLAEEVYALGHFDVRDIKAHLRNAGSTKAESFS